MTDRTTTQPPAAGQHPAAGQDPATGPTADRAARESGIGGGSTTAGAGGYDTTQSESERARRAAEDIKSAAKEAATSTAGAVRNRVSGELDYRKYKSRQRLSRMATALRETGSTLHGDDEVIARYTERAADRVERLAEYLDQKDVNEILADARQMARQRPELFVGSLFVAGLMLGRFLRTSQARPNGGGVEEDDYERHDPMSGSRAYATGYPAGSPSTSTYGAGERSSPSTTPGGLVP